MRLGFDNNVLSLSEQKKKGLPPPMKLFRITNEKPMMHNIKNSSDNVREKMILSIGKTDENNMKLPPPTDENNINLPTPNDENNMDLLLPTDENNINLPTPNDENNMDLPPPTDENNINLPPPILDDTIYVTPTLETDENNTYTPPPTLETETNTPDTEILSFEDDLLNLLHKHFPYKSNHMLMLSILTGRK